MVPVPVGVQLTVALLPPEHPAGSPDQLYEKPPEPPDAMAWNWAGCVRSMDEGDPRTLTAGPFRTVYRIVASTRYPFASMTVTLTLNVPEAVGVQTSVAAAESVHPVGRSDHW